MSRILTIIVIINMLALTGCSSVAIYPEYKKTVRISVSSATPSMIGEAPAGAALIDDSQVIVTGGGSAFFLFFGLTGMAIQEELNLSKVADQKSHFSVKFDTEFSEILRRNASKLPSASQYKYSITKSTRDFRSYGEIEDIWLRPSAWFLIKSNSRAHLQFSVRARFKDKSGSTHDKWYWARDEIRKISGSGSWSENNAALFKHKITKLINRITHVILRDIAGECSNNGEYNMLPVIQWKTLDDEIETSRLLCEGNDYFMTNSWLSDNVYIVDNLLEPIIRRGK